MNRNPPLQTKDNGFTKQGVSSKMMLLVACGERREEYVSSLKRMRNSAAVASILTVPFFNLSFVSFGSATLKFPAPHLSTDVYFFHDLGLMFHSTLAFLANVNNQE